MRVYQLDEQLVCTCGHIWEVHHHGFVQNPEYFDYPLTIRGCIAEECEHSQTNGKHFFSQGEKTYCSCPNFKPRAGYVKQLLNKWREKHRG